MKRKPHTRKPCNGCKETFGRPVDELCSRCRYTLDTAKAMIAAASEQSEFQMFIMHGRAGGFEHFPHVNWKTYEPFQSDMLALARSIATEVFIDTTAPDDADVKFWQEKDYERVFTNLSRDNQGGTKRYYMHAGQRELLNRLYSAALAIAAEAYDAGVAKGRAILAGLAAGTISIDSLNKYEIERAKAVQPAPQEICPNCARWLEPDRACCDAPLPNK